MSVALIAYVIALRPFEEVIDNIEQISYEITIFVVNIALLVMAVKDTQEGDNTQIRERIGDFIIKTNIAAQYLPTIFLVPKLALTARELINKLKKRRRAKVGKLDDATTNEKMKEISHTKMLPIQIDSHYLSKEATSPLHFDPDFTNKNHDQEPHSNFGASPGVRFVKFNTKLDTQMAPIADNLLEVDWPSSPNNMMDHQRSPEVSTLLIRNPVTSPGTPKNRSDLSRLQNPKRRVSRFDETKRETSKQLNVNDENFNPDKKLPFQEPPSLNNIFPEISVPVQDANNATIVNQKEDGKDLVIDLIE